MADQDGIQTSEDVKDVDPQPQHDVDPAADGVQNTQDGASDESSEDGTGEQPARPDDVEYQEEEGE